MPKSVKYIFEIKLKAGCTAKQYMEAWKKGSAIIQKSKGARGTILFRKVDDPTTLLAIASWDSTEIRYVAMESLRNELQEVRNVVDKHEEYATFNSLGYFEEIAQVNPE